MRRRSGAAKERRFQIAAACLGAAFLLAACGGESSQQRPRAPAPGYPQQPYGPPPGYGPAPYGQQPYAPPPGYGYGPPPAQGQPQPPAAGQPAPPVSGDPISGTDIAWLRRRAASLMQELVAALPDVAKQRVQAIPLAVDDTPGEVNAFAGCVRGGAVMVVTDGLLDIAAHLSAARANDDVFGTRKVDEYIQLIVSRQRPEQPVVRPPANFFDPAQATDARRVARQHDVFDETIGFVLGHEIAHHHLGHLPCTGTPGPFGTGDLARGLSSAVPLFNQPNELAADAAGTNDVLAAGARRSGYRLTEGGGLLMMQFFTALDRLSAIDVLFGFERTHPAPLLRIPVIQNTANLYRLSGGGWLPLPRF